MTINSNMSIHDLIKLWTQISFKLLNNIDVSKEEILEFKDIRIILDTKGIERLEVFNIKDEKYSIRYFKYNSECIEEVDIN